MLVAKCRHDLDHLSVMLIVESTICNLSTKLSIPNYIGLRERVRDRVRIRLFDLGLQ